MGDSRYQPELLVTSHKNSSRTCAIILTDVHVAESHHRGAFLQMSGLEQEQEGQIVVSHIHVCLVYAQDLLSKDPEIQQLFTYGPDRIDTELHSNPAPWVNVSGCSCSCPPKALLCCAKHHHQPTSS